MPPMRSRCRPSWIGASAFWIFPAWSAPPWRLTRPMAAMAWRAIWTRCWAPTHAPGFWRKKSVNGWGLKRRVMLQALQGLISWTPLGLPAFLFVITLVVFFHELGHFLVARACGVKVDIFSIGFGREIAGFNDRSGTRWRLSWIPVGGYVKFAGDANAASMPDAEAASSMSPAERQHVLFFKPLWQRAAVAVAGPFANMILAIVLFTGLNLHNGHNVLAPVVGGVVKGSPAAAAGIQPGDRITAVDGAPINDFEQLPEIVSVSGGRNLAVMLDRAGKSLTVHVTPQMMRTRDVLGDMGDTMVIGVRQSTNTADWSHESYSLPGAFGAAAAESWDIAKTTIQGIGQMVRGYASA